MIKARKRVVFVGAAVAPARGMYIRSQRAARRLGDHLNLPSIMHVIYLCRYLRTHMCAPLPMFALRAPQKSLSLSALRANCLPIFSGSALHRLCCCRRRLYFSRIPAGVSSSHLCVELSPYARTHLRTTRRQFSW